MGTRRPWAVAAAGLFLAAVLSGCGGEDRAVIGSEQSPEVGEVTVTSGDSRATVEALCVSDIPEDVTTCPGAPANLGRVELDDTGKATVVVPREVATGGYRVRVNGEPLPQLDGVVNDQNQQLRIPLDAVPAAEETVLTVEALFSPEHPRALWQFLLSLPAEQSS